MTSDLIISGLFVVATIVILAIYLTKAFSIGRRHSLPKGLLRLAGLCLLTTLAWTLLALLAVAWISFSSEPPAFTRAFFFSFGLPLANICDPGGDLPGLGPVNLKLCDAYIEGWQILPVVLYLIGLVPLITAQLGFKRQVEA